MAFEVQDLMVNVFPQRAPWQMGPCEAPTAIPPCEPPSIGPHPCKGPSCQHHSAKKFEEEDVQLPSLAALRADLQRALRS